MRARRGHRSLVRQPQLIEVTLPERQVASKEEVVELRRRHIRPREHRVHLPPVMDLVAEQVQQHVPSALDLHVIRALDAHLGVERGVVRKRLDPTEQLEVTLPLSRAERREEAPASSTTSVDLALRSRIKRMSWTARAKP